MKRFLLGCLVSGNPPASSRISPLFGERGERSAAAALTALAVGLAAGARLRGLITPHLITSYQALN